MSSICTGRPPATTGSGPGIRLDHRFRRLHRLYAYSVDLPAHTYGRNRNSVALSCTCMGGIPDSWDQLPTSFQLTSLCAEPAAILWLGLAGR